MTLGAQNKSEKLLVGKDFNAHMGIEKEGGKTTGKTERTTVRSSNNK